MRKTGNPGAATGPRRWGRAQSRSVTDPYKAMKKIEEPAVCRTCGAVYHAGNWQWMDPPAGAHQELCPACHRIEDEFPAGDLTVDGGFVARHRDEILRIVHRQEEIEKKEHPLNRIMKIEDADDAIVVTTTELHLPRRIGEALKSAFDGDLDLSYDEDGYYLRAAWHRD